MVPRGPGPLGTIFNEILIKFQNFFIDKNALQNGGHFILASMCQLCYNGTAMSCPCFPISPYLRHGSLLQWAKIWV